MNFLTHFYTLFLESSPWLLLGILLAGLLNAFVSMAWMNQQLGGHGLTSTLKAALLGAPLPLCSCGVIPAAIGLRRAGASKAATTSFLVSTPETGVDSISVSYVLLGPFMAIARPIAAVFSAILSGLLVGKDEKQTEKSNKAKENDAREDQHSASACCSTKASGSTPSQSSCCSATTPKPSQSSCCSATTPTPSQSSCCSTTKEKPAQPKTSCCDNHDNNRRQSTNLVGKLRLSIASSATDLLDDTAIWLLCGLGVAALVQTYVPDGFWHLGNNSLLTMLLMIVISTPMYICATASTPIAAGLLLAGVSPGAVLVFMMAGPATNIATLGIINQEWGRRTLMSYLIGVLGGALLCGYVVNGLVSHFDIQVTPQIGPDHELLPYWILLPSAIVLAALMMKSMVKQARARLGALA